MDPSSNVLTSKLIRFRLALEEFTETMIRHPQQKTAEQKTAGKSLTRLIQYVPSTIYSFELGHCRVCYHEVKVHGTEGCHICGCTGYR
jgi:hypothetical protein